jgi:DNA-binding NarL/FixJ family response regulator
MAGPARVAVVEDHPIYRESMARGVFDASDLELVGTFRTVEELEASEVDAEVVILDLHLPGVSGAEAVSRVCERSAVLIVSAGTTRDEVVAAMGAGAHGYVAKDADLPDIIVAVQTVASGGTFVSPTLAGYLLAPSTRSTAQPKLVLTARETEILSLVAAGERDTDIAHTLRITPRTVRSHLDRIRDKTGQRRRPDLTRYALGHDLAPRPEP